MQYIFISWKSDVEGGITIVKRPNGDILLSDNIIEAKIVEIYLKDKYHQLYVCPLNEDFIHDVELAITYAEEVYFSKEREGEVDTEEENKRVVINTLESFVGNDTFDRKDTAENLRIFEEKLKKDYNL